MIIVIVIIIIIVIIKSINILLVFNKTSSLKIVKYRKPYLSLDISRNVFAQIKKNVPQLQNWSNNHCSCFKEFKYIFEINIR